MVIESNGREGGDIDAKLLIFRDELRHYGVKRVITLENDDIVGSYLQAIAFKLAFARWEVITRKLYFLAIKQGIHLLIEENCINGFYALEVIFSLFVERCIDTIDKIVVRRQRMGMQTASHQLNSDTLTGSCLSTAARTCYKHDLCTSLHDFIGNVMQFALLQSLSNVDEFGGLTGSNGSIHLASITHAHKVLPTMILTENAQLLFLRFKRLEQRRVLA